MEDAPKDGGARPQEVALDAVFDNKTFHHMQTLEQTIRNVMATRRSRGLIEDVFRR